MKVVAFNGSARKDGNTAILVKRCLAELESEGINTEFVQLAGKKVRGCIACFKCMKKKNLQCAVDKDDVNEYIRMMREADGIVLASPTYFADITTEIKALIDRAGMVSIANDSMLKRKVGAALVVARRAGSIHAFDSINHFFFINQMVVPGSSYWNVAFGLDKGDVEKDEEGLNTAANLGKNMAWLLKKIHG
jgi:multimeric flavodoxin WrbA